MAEAQAQSAASTITAEQEASLIDQMITATPTVETDKAKDWVRALVEANKRGGLVYKKSVIQTLKNAVANLDAAISKQLGEVMRAPEFQKLEGSWRGLHHLVMNSKTGETMQIRMFNVTKKELFKDLDNAAEFDQSELFKKIYENEFGMPGGKPYGALVGDYEFTNHPDDIALLQKVSGVAAAAHAPFISAAGHQMFGLKSYEDLNKPRDLATWFQSPDYVKWRAFRDTEDARYVTLVMPRVLARLPYGASTKPIEEFGFEEVPAGKSVPHDHYCWMNAAYVFATNLTRAFSESGWCTAIRGAENGGLVQGLPVHLVTDDQGDKNIKCPTEVYIPDRREKELSDLGFLPLCSYKDTEQAVFFGAQTCQKAKKYDDPAATANAAISARLPYLMATSRIAHFLKVIARDWVGGFMERQDLEDKLKNWIANYVLNDPKGSAEMKAKYPLAEAKITVEEIPGAPGSYRAVAHLRPWLQMEELSTSMRLVATMPTKK